MLLRLVVEVKRSSPAKISLIHTGSGSKTYLAMSGGLPKFSEAGSP
jgi:hypothetical protein